MSALGVDFQRLYAHLSAVQAKLPGDVDVEGALAIVDRYLSGGLNGYADPGVRSSAAQP